MILPDAVVIINKDVQAYIRKNPDVCFLHPSLLARDLRKSHSTPRNNRHANMGSLVQGSAQ